MSVLAVGDALVTTGDDPTPLVLALATRLRTSARDPELASEMAEVAGTVSLRSSGDAQRATIVFGTDSVHVTSDLDPSGVPATFDPWTEYVLTGDDELVARLERLLNPPLLDWEKAAARFWSLTCDMRGMPERLVLVDTDDGVQLCLGSGDTEYRISATGSTLSRVLSGHGNVLVSAAIGEIFVTGTLPQLSVICGAHWKVKLHG